MNNKLIGKNIYTYRKAKHMTQKELAFLIDRAESSIQKYEKGEVEVPLSVLETIAQSLGIPMRYILDWTEQESLNTLIFGINKSFQDYLQSIGFRIVYRSDINSGEKVTIVDENENSIEISFSELQDLQKSTESYLRFKMHELFNNDIK